MRLNQKGFTLIEAMLAVLVVAICLLGVIKLMSNSQKSLTQSAGSLQAQASAEELLQRIRLMRLDRGSIPGIRMTMAGPPGPTTIHDLTIPGLAVANWNG